MGASELSVAKTLPAASWDALELGTVLQLSLATAVAFGFARFDYALLLPFMRSELHWTYTQAGALNSVYAVGYLVGAMLAAPLCARWGLRRAFVSSMYVTAIVVGALGLSSSIGVLLSLRAVAGVAGAVLFVAGGALTATVSQRSHRAALAFGVYCAGAGFGMALSALLIPPLVDAAGWRWGWIALGMLSLLAALVAAPAIPRVVPDRHHPLRRRSQWPLRTMSIELVGYGLFGVGYIAYATFIVAYLRNSHALSAPDVSRFWALFGIAAMGGTIVWGPIQARLRGGWGAACTIAVVAAGAALPLSSQTGAAAYLSALLFGGSFLSVVAAVTAFAHRVAPPEAWTRAIGALTIAVSLGQCLGPVLTGWLSDRFGGLECGLELSMLILILAVLCLPFQRETDVPY